MYKKFFNNKFIVVEGIEGAGKKHACLLIKQILKMNGIKNVISIREPGSTAIAEKIRILIKEQHYKEKIINITELLLIYAARTQLIETIVKPALKKGKWIISDRHDLSSFAYQGGGSGISSKTISKIRKICLKNFYPDLTVYLDVDPEIGLKRAFSRGNVDRIEKKNINFFIRTRERYLELISKNPKSITINANKNLYIVQQTILKKIKKWLKIQT
ncbi:Thymidylate kinase [Buchnera aphidicola (Eriosoma grossulariae)]|uniref:dTMP kinase n=1 Tax=Buchnera aphidicola TaxID=9 RepID=UPI003464A54B